MAKNVHQTKVIENLNNYFKWHNFPFKMNKEGVCNGLAMVHAKYVLEGKEQEFMDILEFIAEGKQKINVSDDQINLFAMQVLVTFSPKKYDQRLEQSNAMELLTIKGQPLKSSFDFSIVTKEKNWVQIIESIGLKDREVMQLSSATHAISLHKVDGKYRLYDPNYESGFKDFGTAKQLVHELRKNDFGYSKGNFGMGFHVIRHPDDLEKERKFPTQEELYKKYLPDIQATVKSGKRTYDSLCFASQSRQDGTAIRYLLDQGATNYYQAAIYAADTNNVSALSPLLENITEEYQQKNLFEIVLKNGRHEAFKELLNHESFKSYYNNKMMTIAPLAWAAEGGNPKLLQESIDNFRMQLYPIMVRMMKDRGSPPPFRKEVAAEMEKQTDALIANSFGAQKFTNGDVLQQAILGGSQQCMELILNTLDAGGKPLTVTDRARYLAEAIRHNQRHIALELMDRPPSMSPEVLNTITMTVQAIRRTDLALLKSLEARGMKFSTPAQLIIAKKEHQSLGLLESLGVVLYKFTSYLKEKLEKKESMGVFVEPEATQNMRQKLQTIKNTSTVKNASTLQDESKDQNKDDTSLVMAY